MKWKRLFVVVVWVSFILLMGTSPSSVLCAERIELSWISFSPKEDPGVDGVVRGFINRATEKAKGELVFRHRGGPETMAAFDQGAAIQKGIFDITMVPFGFYEPIAPGVGGAMLTQVSLAEERKPGGGYDYLNKLHKKGGLFYLGRANPSDEYLTISAVSPADPGSNNIKCFAISSAVENARRM